MGESTVSDRSGTKQRIKEAALGLFMTRGFEQTSVRELAAAVGMSPSNLYSHFASKELLLRVMLEEIYRAYGTQVAEILHAEAPFLHRFDALVALVCRLYDEDALRLRFLLRYGEHEYAAEVYCRHSPVHLLIASIRDAIDRGEIEPVNPVLTTGMLLGGLRENANLARAGLAERLHTNYAELVGMCHRLLPAMEPRPALAAGSAFGGVQRTPGAGGVAGRS